MPVPHGKCEDRMAESAEIRCVQFLFEPGAILLNGFQRNL